MLKNQPLVANQTRSSETGGKNKNKKKSESRNFWSSARLCSSSARSCSGSARSCSGSARSCSGSARSCSGSARSCSGSRAQYSTVRFAQAGEVNNFSSDLRIFGRLCDSSLISVTDCLFRGDLSTLAKFHSISTCPHSVVVEV